MPEGGLEIAHGCPVWSPCGDLEGPRLVRGGTDGDGDVVVTRPRDDQLVALSPNFGTAEHGFHHIPLGEIRHDVYDEYHRP